MSLAFRIAMSTAVVGLMVLGAALVETIRWWMNWRGRPVPAPAAPAGPPPRAIVVYLSGCSDYARRGYSPEQAAFLDALARSHPDCLVARRPFPFLEPESHACCSLRGEMAGASACPYREPPILPAAIRNAWQVALASLPGIRRRYGRNVAEQLVMELRRLYPDIERAPIPVVLIGASAGAQLAVVSAPRLVAQFGCPVYLVALGGVHGAGAGLGSLAHLYALWGRRDGWRHLSLVFPGRWAVVRGRTAYGAILARGGLSARCIGAHAHHGRRGYLSGRRAPGTGRSYLDLTLSAIDTLDLWSTLDTHAGQG